MIKSITNIYLNYKTKKAILGKSKHDKEMREYREWSQKRFKAYEALRNKIIEHDKKMIKEFLDDYLKILIKANYGGEYDKNSKV